jgi:hypothetical protein
VQARTEEPIRLEPPGSGRRVEPHREGDIVLDLKSAWSRVGDKRTWDARRATFVAKLGATKAVWFPPGPTSTPKKAAAKGRKTTKKTAKKTSRAATKAKRPTKQAASGSSR